ncbi:hypothetical protein [Klebsiella oxytoca]|uniref:hypothetical protein n=1 Tax=Klebsiella oxytoca TaxID=571 RepID=UPI002A2D3ACD|nr:hypothetical protein [Klebsiella oxytoca]MDM4329938.1 hypothetical protein [Klebsiella oxytoca]
MPALIKLHTPGPGSTISAAISSSAIAETVNIDSKNAKIDSLNILTSQNMGCLFAMLLTPSLRQRFKPREGANKRGNSSRLTQSFHFFMFEPIFSPVNALNQPI